MIFRQQLFRISNTVSVQSKFLPSHMMTLRKPNFSMYLPLRIVLTVGAKKVG